MKTPTSQPHRHHERVPFFEPVRIRKPLAMITQATDLGLGGIGLRSPKGLDLGTQVEMDSFAGQAVFWGKISWCKSLGSGFRIGAEFTQVDLEVLARIRDLRSGRAGSLTPGRRG
ncbi:MAG: PilZ domain-containing protein [Opitutales bacterium]